MNFLELLKLAMPEAILATAALAALLVDLAGMREVGRRYRRAVGATITVLGCFVAGFWLVQTEAAGTVGHGMLVVDPLTRFLRLVLLGLTALPALISLDS